MAVLAGMDFFTAEVLTWRGLATYYVLFVIQLETRRVTLAGITRHPSEDWMQQMARNLTDAECGALHGQRYLLHDRDAKFCAGFRSILRDGGVKPLRLPPSSPDLNAFAERWVRSVKEECLSRLILFGEASLQRALTSTLRIFMPSARIRERETSCCSPSRLSEAARAIALNADNVWEACSGIMRAPHE
jgi:putative transposase